MQRGRLWDPGWGWERQISYFNRLLGSFRRGVFRWFEFSGLQLLEAKEGSGDLAVEGDLVAEEEFVSANAFTGAAQSEDCTERTGVPDRYR